MKKAYRYDDEIVFYFDAFDNKYVAQGGSLAWRLNNPGLLLFDNWQTRLENRLRSGDLPPHMEAHLAKYKKLVPALSLIFHYLFRLNDQQISKDALKYAIVWAEYLESHAEKVYHSGMQAVQKGAMNLIRRIQKGEVKEPFSARDVYQGHRWSGLADAKEVEEVLSLLFV